MSAVAYWLLKIELEPPAGDAWRTLCVPSGLRMDLLHLALEIALGLRKRPLHEFQTAAGDLAPENLCVLARSSGQESLLPEKDFFLKDAVSPAHPVFYYSFDPEEGFRCRIRVESFRFRNLSGQDVCCTGGEGTAEPDEAADELPRQGEAGFDDFCRFADLYDRGRPFEELRSPPPVRREPVNITAVNRELKKSFVPLRKSPGESR